MKGFKFLSVLATSLKTLPGLSLAGLVLALFAQMLLEPPAQPLPAFVIYLSAMGFIAWAIFQGEWELAALPQVVDGTHAFRLRLPIVILSFSLLAAAFYFLGGNLFTPLNLILWLSGLALLVYPLWTKGLHELRGGSFDWEWMGLLAAAVVLAAFFRFYRLGDVPAEPFSDHAEKILDLADLARGQASIFFERNTGREALQIYWTWLVAKVFGTGNTFLSLKLGSALLGFFTLPFMYLLGRELGNPMVGFLAMFIFGTAYWPNVIARIGLRFPLYPLFVAPTLFHLIRGLRTGSGNDFLACGLFLGLGLHGYSPFRIMPFIVVAGVSLHLLHHADRETRRRALRGLVILAVVALAVFLPLLRYWMDNPDKFGFRAWSRLGLAGGELPGEAWIIFLSNLLRASLMFNWDDGGIWVNSIPHRPALDAVTAVLFAVGVLLYGARYLRRRDWRDLFLLISVPLLLMPSVLSLAYPLENPALNRAGGASVVGAILCAGALEGVFAGFRQRRLSDRFRTLLGTSLVAALMSASVLQNYNLVFREFDESYRLTVWNSSEMAEAIREHGDIETVWIIPYPQWVDTRLPAMLQGHVDRDLAVWPDELAGTRKIPGPKMFIYKPQDLETEKALSQIYPRGTISRYTSRNIGKDFMIFQVED
jgi:hypothetical protein